eukprot:TRINITY_DN17633_c0_g1_i1.p1 TRINITY_DN17633_c0_g1~~TRINITY_DN17633_c0_g1_i1.p1  ORF type:complete len:362 (-),score=37.50 TRINITY_DN17633_c0_g1_i1:308-1393(-)
MLPHFFTSLMVIALASFFDSSFFYVGVIFMLYCLKFVFRRRLVFLLLVTMVVGLTILTDSMMLAFIVSVALLASLGDILRERLYHRKILFYISLVLLGGSIILVIWGYQQRFQGVLRRYVMDFIIYILEEKIEGVLPVINNLETLISSPTTKLPTLLLFFDIFSWPSFGTTTCHQNRWLIPLLPITLVIASWFRDILMWHTTVDPIDFRNLRPILTDVEVSTRFAEQNGLVWRFNGNKPEELVPSKVMLYYDGPQLDLDTNNKKLLLGTHKLTPRPSLRDMFKMDSKQVNGSFSLVVKTGINRETVKTELQKLGTRPNNPNPRLTFMFVYTSNRWFQKPRQGLLFQVSMQASALLFALNQR